MVELHGVGRERGKLWLELGAVDLLDGTPVVDIKPYIPYADSLPDARGGFAEAPPLVVSFTPKRSCNCSPGSRLTPSFACW